MTVLTDRVTDIAGASESTPLVFWVPELRENDTRDGIITKPRHYVYARDGVFTTPDLDVGPAMVQIGLDQYPLMIPASSSPVRLWPLIDASTPAPTSYITGWVRDGGGLARGQVVTRDQWEAAQSYDPETVVFIVEKEEV